MDVINVYALVAPAVFVMILAEFIYCMVKKNGYYSFQDSLIGTGTMIMAQCVNVAVAVGVVMVYGWVQERFGLFKIEKTLTAYILCYLGSDFLFYWFHRAGHRINLFWAIHVPHHSAEELNYAVGLRASLTQRAASFLFYWPLALIGFPVEMIIPIVALNLVIQLIPHTRVIPKLPSWIDSWLNTPYHHQVHHAANPIYWDKNMSGTFIIWDKLFGTYSDQTEEPYYGVTIHPESWDPTYLNFHWFIVLYRDMKAATHFVDKILIWFKPPGWRPRNLPPYEKKPAHDAKSQVKYRTVALPGSTPYLLFQLVACMAIMFLVIANHSPIHTWEKVAVFALLWLSVTAWGGILESKPWVGALEGVRLVIFGVLGAGILTRYFEAQATLGLSLMGVYILVTALFLISLGKKNIGMKSSESY